MSQLIDASIWSLMKSDIDIDQYEYAEGDEIGRASCRDRV